jgi:hypothetical protein
MFAALLTTQDVGASRSAFSGQFASPAVDDVTFSFELSPDAGGSRTELNLLRREPAVSAAALN